MHLTGRKNPQVKFGDFEKKIPTADLAETIFSLPKLKNGLGYFACLLYAKNVNCRNFIMYYFIFYTTAHSRCKLSSIFFFKFNSMLI